MNTLSQQTENLNRIIISPSDGVVGLVNDLLQFCDEHQLQLHWEANRCRIRSKGGDWEELSELSIRKSVFRAVLARIATICNEQSPNSVSPYCGQAELAIGENPQKVLKVTFTNTPSEQKLELLPII
jgi:hypothetical protein